MASLLTTALAEQVYPVAVRAHSGAEAAIKTWQPTIDYLNKTISGHRFELIPYPHLSQQLDDALDKKFAFILTNPATYVELQHLTDARALVTLINKRQGTAQTQFGSVIFTRADRDDIIHLHDLKGKHLKAVSPLGFGGWRVAWLEMLHNAFDPYEKLGQLSFTDGNQPAVVKAIQTGTADAGVVRTDMLERLAQKGEVSLTEFRILHNVETEGFPFFHSTPLYPEWPFAVMPDVSDELTTQVKQALLNIKQDHPAAQAGQYNGWTQALDYTSVDNLLKELHIGPYKNTNDEKLFIHYLYPVGIFILLMIIFLALRKPSANN